MSKKLNPLSTAIAIAVATAMIGGCAMQTRNEDQARADTEDSSHMSTNTTLTAQGDPVPDVITTAQVETAPIVTAQAEPMPATGNTQTGQWDSSAQTASASNTDMSNSQMSTQPATPTASTYPSVPDNGSPAPVNATTATTATTANDTNASYNNDQPAALPPRADRN